MIYSVIDVETTGGSPKSSKITEIAIFRHDGKQVIDEFISLVNPETHIPEFVSNLTGITDDMVEDAPKFYEIAKKIVEFTEGTIFVAHNVNFDYGMIRTEFKRLGYDYRLPHMCTVKTSRQFIPGEASYSLGKLSKSLEIELKGRHRAGGDALATAKLLSLIIERGGEQVNKFIQDELNPQTLHPGLDLDAIEDIPNKNGIYKFFDEMNQLIYLGKGTAIRTNIEAHLKRGLKVKSAAWVKEIVRVEFELTGNELIASILEYQLLKKGIPRYNRKPRKKKGETDESLFDGQFEGIDFGGDSFFLLGKGRNKHEKSLILIENGCFSGWGYAPYHLHRLDTVMWKKFITISYGDDTIQHMIFNFMKKDKLTRVDF